MRRGATGIGGHLGLRALHRRAHSDGLVPSVGAGRAMVRMAALMAGGSTLDVQRHDNEDGWTSLRHTVGDTHLDVLVGHHGGEPREWLDAQQMTGYLFEVVNLIRRLLQPIADMVSRVVREALRVVVRRPGTAGVCPPAGKLSVDTLVSAPSAPPRAIVGAAA